MLILSRRVFETLKIGEEINVTILGVKGNQVRIGIQAPEDIEVLREELIANDNDSPPPLKSSAC